MKVGKSTFVYPLAIAVSRGEPFLDRATQKGGVLIIAIEEHPDDVDRRLRKLGMRATDRIYVHSGQKIDNRQEEIAKVAEFVRQNEIVLVLIDSIAYFWDVKNENDNAEVTRALEPLLDLARHTKAAVCFTHHESKSGGRDAFGRSTGDGRTIRGASAILGMLDQALMLQPYGSGDKRKLQVKGRHTAEGPRELVMELVGDTALSNLESTYEYRLVGEDELSKAVAKSRVLAVVTDQPQSIQAIAKQADVSDKAARGVLEAEAGTGTLIREGKGRKNDPLTFRRDIGAPSDSARPEAAAKLYQPTDNNCFTV
jgi:hypothetical protein